MAKNPPELNDYVRIHGQHLNTVLRPTGFKYSVLQGSTMSRVLALNLTSLDADMTPTQEASFRRAARKAIQDVAPLSLAAHTAPESTNAALEVETAVNGEADRLVTFTSVTLPPLLASSGFE